MADSPVLTDEEIRRRFTATFQSEIGRELDLNGEPYRIESIIGDGESKIVYNAIQTKTGKSVALQLYKADFDPRQTYSKMLQDALDKGDAALMARLSSIFLEYEPTNDYAAFNLAVAYTMQNAHEQATKAFERALELNPSDVATLFHLALCKAIIGHPDDAVRLMLRAHHINPQELEQYAAMNMRGMDALVAAMKGSPQAEAVRELVPRYCDLKRAPPQAPSDVPAQRDGSKSNLPDIREFAPLLPDAMEISVSEFDVPEGVAPVHNLGTIMTVIHSIGMVHGDLNAGNAILNEKTGRFVVIDLATAEQHELSPRYMMADIIVPYGSFEKGQFEAFLAGYIKGMVTDLEPMARGYAEEFLGLLGGRVTNIPINPKSFLLQDVLGETLSITVQGKAAHMRLSPSLSPSQLAASETRDLLLAAAIARACGISVSGFEPLFDTAMTTVGHLRETIRFLGSDPRASAAIAGQWNRLDGCLLAIAMQTDKNRPTGEFKANLAMIGIAKAIYQAARFDDDDSLTPLELIDNVMAMLLYLARAVGPREPEPEPEAYHAPAEFIQIADMILQQTLTNGRADEARYCTLQAHKMRVPWFREIIKTGKPRLRGIIDLSLLNSDAVTGSTIFRNSVVEAGMGKRRLWSAAFASKSKYHNIITALRQTVSERQPKPTGWLRRSGQAEATDDELLILELALRNYSGLLYQMIEGSLAYPEYARLWARKPKDQFDWTLMDELEWSTQAAKTCKGIKDAGQLSQLLSGLDRFS